MSVKFKIMSAKTRAKKIRRQHLQPHYELMRSRQNEIPQRTGSHFLLGESHNLVYEMGLFAGCWSAWTMQVEEEVAAESIVHPPTLDTFQRRGTTQITSLAAKRSASTLLSRDKYKFTIINSANRVGVQIRRHKFK